MTTNQYEELQMLKNNLAAGTCIGLPASKEQQAVRRRRIKQLEGLRV